MSVIRHAQKHTSFFGGRINKVGTKDYFVPQLSTIVPFTRKSLINQSESAYVASGLPKFFYSETGTTSGSTGEPIKFVRVKYTTDTAADKYYFDAKQWRFLLWESKSLNKIVNHTKILELKAGKSSTNRLFITIDDIRNDFAGAVKKIAHFQPEVLAGYTTFVHELALQSEKDGMDLTIPYTVTGGKPFNKEEEQYITNLFNTKIFNRYSLEEFRSIAMECHCKNGLHIHAESFHIEILNEMNQPMKAGKTGRVILTDLYNLAMPYIRYDTGDYGYIDTTPCACGLRSPRLFIQKKPEFEIISGSKIIGRADINDRLSKYFRVIQQYQIIRIGECSYKFILVPGPTYEARHQTEITSELQILFDQNIEFRIDVQDTVPVHDATGSPLYVEKINE